MNPQTKQNKLCETVQEKLRNLKEKPATETSFFENIAIKIMAELMGSDKDTIMEKYCDNNIPSEELEEHLYRLASAAIWSSEILCRSLIEDDVNV